MPSLLELRAILPVSGDCPICFGFYVGLKKHFNVCYAKNQATESNAERSSISSKQVSNDAARLGSAKPNATNGATSLGSTKPNATNGTTSLGSAKPYGDIINSRSGDGANQLFNFSDSYFDNSFFNQTFFETNSLLADTSNITWISFLTSLIVEKVSNCNFLHLNINSINGKLFEIHSLLDLNLFDIIFLQETKLGPEDSDHFLQHKEYSFLRRDRDVHGGGIIIYIKKSLTVVFSYIDPSSKFEFILFSILINNKKINFIYGYNPQYKLSKNFLDRLNTLIIENNFNKSNTFILGDFNQDLFTAHGKKLLSLMKTLNFLSVVSEPTRVTESSATLIDNIFTNSISLIDRVSTVDCPFSDHKFVFCSLNLKSPKINKCLITSRCLDNRKIEIFREKLSLVSFTFLDSVVDVNDKWFALRNCLTKLLDEVAPAKPVKIKLNNLAWFDGELKQLFNLRDKLFSKALKNDKSRAGPLWSEFRNMRNICKSKLRLKMTEYFSKKTFESFGSPQKYWDFYKSVVKTKKTSSNNKILCLKDPQNVHKYRSEDLADIFNRHFTNIKNGDKKSLEEANEYIDHFFGELRRSNVIKVAPDSFRLSHTTSEEVINIIGGLSSSGSPGVSGIPVTILKNCATLLADPLTKLFNSCISSSTFPNEWKCAIVTPLFKKGPMDECDNYRGISVLPPVSKVFEKILASRITKHFEDNNLFTSQQHGFRANHSCETALQSILDEWKSLIDDGQTVMSLFIDFKKAFDLVDSRLLLRKLGHYGFDNNSIYLLRSYFQNRTQITKVESTKSSLLDLTMGVPQGTILGPLLFLIFINDLCYKVLIKKILFADDTSLYDSSRDFESLINSFNESFKLALEWISYNNLCINWDKTKVMFLSKAHIKPPINVNLCGSNVEVVSDFKLLGICIDNGLIFNKYVDSLKKSVNTKLYSISKIFYLSYPIKIQFFKTFIQPHFDYCSSLTIYMSKTLISQIEKLFNNCVFKLLKINLFYKTLDEQYSCLHEFNILPYKLRIFSNLCSFSHKILNNKILPNIKKNLSNSTVTYNLRDKPIFVVPKYRTKSGSKRLTIFLSNFINKTIRFSYMLTFTDFKYFISSNILILFKNMPTQYSL